MKWFHHDTDMHRNRKVRKLIRVHGATGYAFWSVLLEKIYANEDGFQIEADELWFEDIAEDLKLGDYRTPIRILDTLAELGLIDKQLWADHVVFCPAIAERGDRYIIKRTYEREKKRKQRASKAQKRNDEGQFTEMSLGDTEGTKGQVRHLSPSDPDPDPDPDPDLNKGLKNKHMCPTDAGQATVKASKKKSKPKGMGYTKGFEEWWLKYYRFCLSVDCSAGKKPEAFKEWENLGLEDGDRSAFDEGTAYYQESKQLEYSRKGDAVGVPHGCRFLKNSKWQEELDRKRFRSGADPETGAPSLAAQLKAQLDRLGINAVLPPDWARTTGKATVGDLSDEDKKRYLATLQAREVA